MSFFKYIYMKVTIKKQYELLYIWNFIEEYRNLRFSFFNNNALSKGLIDHMSTKQKEILYTISSVDYVFFFPNS